MLHLERINIPPRVLNLIAEIDEFKGAWRALETHTTSLQLLGDVAHFGKNFKSVLEPWENQKITEDVVRQLHGVVLGRKGKTPYRATNFPLVIQKDQTIYGTLDTASADEAQALMGKLMPWLDAALAEKKFHPLFVISLFAAVFIQLSPFENGNQRLMRMLVTLLMFKAGYSYAPYAALEPLLTARLREYRDVLAKTQESLESGKADWEPWLVFFLGLLKDQKDTLQNRLEKGGDNIAAMPELSEKILRLFEENERISMKEIERRTRGRRSTLKLRLNELVTDGYIVRHGKARATWYSKVA
jgi:Fic family protein